MSYELRRLRLHGLIERIPSTHRYRLTHHGLATAIFFTRAHARLIRPALAELADPNPPAPGPIRTAFNKLTTQIDHATQHPHLAA
jgi:hypothetical protein